MCKNKIWHCSTKDCLYISNQIQFLLKMVVIKQNKQWLKNCTMLANLFHFVFNDCVHSFNGVRLEFSLFIFPVYLFKGRHSVSVQKGANKLHPRKGFKWRLICLRKTTYVLNNELEALPYYLISLEMKDLEICFHDV